MWMSKEALKLINAAQERSEKLLADLANTLATSTRLEIENARLRSDMDWFKHRINALERERGQFFQAQLGIKIAVPEFVPTYEDPASALSEMPDLSHVGGDAAVESDAEPGDGVDFSLMPGYKGNR